MSQALHLHQQGKLAQAEPLCRQVLAASPGHAEAMHMLDVVALRQRRLEEAERLMAAALAISPDSAEALSNRGTTLAGARAPRGSAGELRQGAWRSSPASPRRCTIAAICCGTWDAWKRRLPVTMRAVASRPGYVEAHFNRGNLLRDLGRLEEALASYDAVLAVRPDHACTLRNRGDALLKLRRFEEALASYDKALAIRPDQAEVLNNRAAALLRLNRSEEALASCDKALAISRDFAEAFKQSRRAR